MITEDVLVKFDMSGFGRTHDERVKLYGCLSCIDIDIVDSVVVVITVYSIRL